MNPTQNSPVRRPAALATATFALLMGSAAAAQMPSDAVKKACRADFSKLCKSIQPGGGRIVACLKKHEAQLSSACSSALGIASDCSQEIKQICGQTTAARDSAEVHDCLQLHADKFTPACRTQSSEQ